MLFLHETHSVTGRREEEFEDAFRGTGGYVQRLAENADARLLWYLDHAHGAGPSYTVTTITAVRDGAAWERLAERVHSGDMRDWVEGVDAVRHGAVSKLLRPLPWSKLQEVDLDAVPIETGPVEIGSGELVLYMEDTAYPYEGRVHDYVEVAGRQYAPVLERPGSMLEMVGAFQPAFGAGARSEVILWQRVTDHTTLIGLLSSTVPARFKGPGTWMHDALDVRDQWQSRLLRTAAWSPLR